VKTKGFVLDAFARREFLRALSASVGGALLTTGTAVGLGSCGGGGDVANAYRLFAVRQGAGTLALAPKPGSDALMTMAAPGDVPLHFQGDPMLADDGQLIFQAVDVNDTVSLRSIQLAFSARTPRALSERVVVATGQTLDGATVDHLDGVDVSASGILALVLSMKTSGDTIRHVLYVDRKGQITKLVSEGDPVEGDHVFSGIFHDVAIDNQHVLFVARYLHKSPDLDDGEPSTGLFVVPLDGTRAPRLLVRTGDLPLTPEHPITGLGLTDLHGLHYAVEAYVRYRDPTVTDMTDVDGQQKIILQGTIDGRQPVVIAAETLLADVVGPAVHVGEQLAAPRVHDGRIFFTLADEKHHYTFTNTGPRTSTKETSPSGYQPLLMSTAVPVSCPRNPRTLDRDAAARRLF
jgi:hypothetical protein